MNISGVLVRAWPGTLNPVKAALNALDGVEVHATEPDGRLVVTVEEADRTVGTAEKFEAKRLQLARNVWRAMKTTDSRECRNCHDFESMDFTAQQSRARDRHAQADKEGKTCIDCHRGIAHQLPEGGFQEYEALVKELAEN